MAKPPVFLDRPEVVILFRAGPAAGHPLESRGRSIYDLTDIYPRVATDYQVNLTQGLGRTITVRLREFPFHPDFKTKHVWNSKDGMQELKMPPLCLAHMEQARNSLKTYIRESWCRYLLDIATNSTTIVREVLMEAQRYCSINRNPFVRRALMLLAINRMIEWDWSICTPGALSLPIVDDEESPWCGKAPITPVMDTQLDQIVIKDVLLPLRRKLLPELQAKMQAGQKEEWFEIFLVVFILSTNTEWLLRHSRKNAKRYGAKGRYNSMKLGEEYFHGANIILAHFHYLCCGTSPLLLDPAEDGLRRVAGLHDHHAEFLDKLQHMIRSEKQRVMGLRRGRCYEEELYWSHQLFFKNWTPEERTIADPREN